MATPARYGFELTGADGGPLRGDVRTARLDDARPAVVLCHGYQGFKDWGFFPHVAHRLAAAGMTAVSFNFSGSGVGPDGETFSESERFGHNTPSRELEDLSTVWHALEGGRLVSGLVPPGQIGLFGHSRGGGIAILFAEQDDAGAAALVTWAAISTLDDDTPWERLQWRRRGVQRIVSWQTGEFLPLYVGALDDLDANRERLNIVRAAGRVRVPWLIVHGAKDEGVRLGHARRLAKAARPGIAELMVLSQATHTFGVRHPFGGSTRELDTALDATTAFFVWHLL